MKGARRVALLPSVPPSSSMSSSSLPPMLYFLFLLTVVLPPRGISASPAIGGGRCCDVGTHAPPSREFFRVDGEVVWVVQVSDLHLSAFHSDRARDLEALLAPALRVVQPSLLIVTGDLTDAKNEGRTSTRQDESEWVQYRDSMDAVVRKSGIDRRRVFDIRGNHDKYGVPCAGDKLDFFSVYSTSAQLNRTSTIQSVSLLGNKRRYVFVGVDDTMTVGLRGPSNFFGHPTDERIKALEQALRHSDAEPTALTTKIVFGHFPMSFTASSESGKRYESIFSARSVSAYLCGHLHAKFSKQLWRLHTSNVGSRQQFWEWELGDWKESRLIRILAIDQGDISFLDLKLNSHGLKDDFPTTVLVTYPIDSQSMSQRRPDDWVARNDINALVFSIHTISNVTAIVFDSLRAFKAVEEIPLQLVAKPSIYSAKWNAEAYTNASATRYWLQVFAWDVHGKKTASILRPFSVEGKPAHLPTTLLTRLVFYVQWDEFYPVLLWSNILFLATLLFLPKLMNCCMGNNLHWMWSASVYCNSAAGLSRSHFWPIQFLMEGSRNKTLWSLLVLYLVCLLCFPWFRGYATSVDGDLGTMSILGWMIMPFGCPIWKELRMGKPDVMTITLPFMYLVVTPLFLLIHGLLAEKSAFFSHPRKEASCQGERGPFVEQLECNRQLAPALVPRSTEAQGTFRMSSICRTRTRMGLLSASMILTYVYLKHFLAIGRAYGVGPVALSPIFGWAPPILLATAVYLSR